MSAEYDERFDELTGLLRKVAGRVDEMQLDMRDMRKEVREVRSETSSTSTELRSMRSELQEFGSELHGYGSELHEYGSRFDKLEAAFYVTSGKQDDVIPKVIEIQKTVNRLSEIQSEQTFKLIEMLNRLNTITIQLRAINGETDSMKLEIREIRQAILSLNDPIQIGWDLRENMKEIERRVTEIEQKIAN